MNTFSGVGAGSYGALGGEITFEWIPDPNVLAGKIMELAGYLENFIPPLEASKGIAKQDMEMHFDTESSPDGGAWAPLADSYVQKRGSAHPILQLTGAMKEAAVSDAAYMIDGHDLFFDASGLPFYYIFHETGRQGVSGMAEFFARARAQGFNIPEGTSNSSGGGMPARPFIGISFAAQLAIIEVFDAWFEGGVGGFYVHPTGTVQTRGAGGKFGPAIGIGG